MPGLDYAGVTQLSSRDLARVHDTERTPPLQDRDHRSTTGNKEKWRVYYTLL